jgi:nicotinamide mononucleotide transporter
MRSTLILLTLTLATSGLALFMFLTKNASLLEAVSFITGAICVWLTVKENVWNFPLGLANVATFFVVFWGAHLYADASLQVVYFVLGLVGWYLWMYGGKNRTALRIHRASNVELATVLVTIALLTWALYRTLTYFSPHASFFDALTTAISLGAQWLLNRKRLENWMLWIVVDAIYIPLYMSKELHLTAILYAVFLVMAVIGHLQWRATWRRQKIVEGPGFEVITPAVHPFPPATPPAFPVLQPEDPK